MCSLWTDSVCAMAAVDCRELVASCASQCTGEAHMSLHENIVRVFDSLMSYV